MIVYTAQWEQTSLGVRDDGVKPVVEGAGFLLNSQRLLVQVLQTSSHRQCVGKEREDMSQRSLKCFHHCMSEQKTIKAWHSGKAELLGYTRFNPPSDSRISPVR
jgi:hypothetical protein